MTKLIPASAYPAVRMRRLRAQDWSRRLVRETRLTPDNLVWGLIIHDGEEPRLPVSAMPGVDRLNVEEAVKAAERAAALGIPALALFPHIDPSRKDPRGEEALNPDGLVPEVVRAIKAAVPGIGLSCDVALDPYTSHGHDGVLDPQGRVANDETVEMLVRQAIVQAQAGADIVAPSDMMDGRIGALRAGLDAFGFSDALILSYAAKYASAYYGPYREAVGTLGVLKGDKRTYQMDYGNSDEALREVALDLSEGADMVMVKPGLPYLDIISRITSTFGVPTLAFQVSGEYAQIRAAGLNGWIDEDRTIIESLTSFRRAGACGIITYFAERAAQLLA